MRFLISLLLIPLAYWLGGWYTTLAYLVGAIPFAWIIYKLVKNGDLRTIGSGNPGAGQVLRLMGPFWFAYAMILDAMKGTILIRFALVRHDPFWTVVLVGVFAVLGHLFGLWLKGNGGKGAATSFGILLALNPLAAAIVLIVWIVVAKLTKYVSMATIWAAIATIVLQTLPLPFQPEAGFRAILMMFGALVLVKHYPNIIRLAIGKERKIGDPEPESTTEVAFLVHSQSPDPNYYREKIMGKLGRLAILVGWMPASWILSLLRLLGSFKYAEVLGVTSLKTYKQVNMRVVAIAYSADELLANEPKAFKLMCRAISKVIIKYRVVLVGLGAYTAIVCDNGRQLARKFQDQVSIISGNVLTTISAVKSLVKLAALAGYDLSNETVVIIGGTGSIGRAVAKWLMVMTKIKKVILVGRSDESMISAVEAIGSNRVDWERSLRVALSKARLVVCAVSVTELDIASHWFLPGTIVVEISRPRVLNEKLDQTGYRSDILVIAGGMYELPGNIVSTFKLGFKSNEFLACTSETFLRVLAGQVKTSVGKNIEFEELVEMESAAKEHGFVLGRFRPCDDGAFDPVQVQEFFSGIGRSVDLNHFVIR